MFNSVKAIIEDPDLVRKRREPLVEEGVKGFDFTTWVGVFVPARTPDAIVGKLNVEIAKALQRDDVKKHLSVRAMEPLPMSREEFGRHLASDYAKTGKIIHATGQQLKEE